MSATHDEEPVGKRAKTDRTESEAGSVVPEQPASVPGDTPILFQLNLLKGSQNKVQVPSNVEGQKPLVQVQGIGSQPCPQDRGHMDVHVASE
eukprot:1252460-Amphidinium_carterae.1